MARLIARTTGELASLASVDVEDVLRTLKVYEADPRSCGSVRETPQTWWGAYVEHGDVTLECWGETEEQAVSRLRGDVVRSVATANLVADSRRIYEEHLRELLEGHGSRLLPQG